MDQAPKISQLQRIEALTVSLLRKRDQAVQFRAGSGVEQRWRDDQDMFEGLDINTKGPQRMLDYATGEAWIGDKRKQPKGSKVVVNIIRGKCNTAEGRFSEISLPTDDMNWGIDASPVPEMAFDEPAKVQQAIGTAMQAAGAQPAATGELMSPGAMQGQMAPPDANLLAAKYHKSKADAEKKAKAMQDEIEDQLEECDFNNECRKVAQQAFRLGTGVMKGPGVVKVVKKAWQPIGDGEQQVWVVKRSEKNTPSSRFVDCWNVYPDPDCGDDPQRGAYIWEKDDHVLPRDLKALIGVPGYSRTQIINVLQQQPKRTMTQPEKGGSAPKVQSTYLDMGNPYERWEYHGDVNREDLEAMGCSCPDAKMDDAKSFSACVVIVNDEPIKAVLNLLDTGGFPYDFFQDEQVQGSCWGIGEVRKLMWPARIMNGGWRGMMNNAGNSSSGFLVMHKSVEPDDDIYQSTGLKGYVVDDDEVDVSKAFAQFQLKSNQQDLQRIIELALKFTDLESGTPALAQGEKGSSPETLGGMQLLMQGADTNRRRQVKRWDDQITKPHIQRYYDWNMQYNPNNEIKGDFEVDARGTSVLLLKEEAGRALQQIYPLLKDPEFAVRINKQKYLDQLLESMHLDILNTPEEEAAERQKMSQQKPPVDPTVQAAQIRAESAERIKDADLQGKAVMQGNEINAEFVIKMLEERMQSTEMTETARLAMEEFKKDIGIKALELKTQRDLSASSQAHNRDIAVAGHMVDLHKSEITKPPTEPAGRAPDGQSYQA